MYDAAVMGVGQGPGEALDDLDSSLHGIEGVELWITTAEALDHRLQGHVTRDVLHREEVVALVSDPDVVDREQVRVLELTADLGLLHEAAQDPGVVSRRGQDLHSDLTLEVAVVGQEDPAHAPAADLTQDLVFVAEGRSALGELGLGLSAGVGPPPGLGDRGVDDDVEARGGWEGLAQLSPSGSRAESLGRT